MLTSPKHLRTACHAAILSQMRIDRVRTQVRTRLRETRKRAVVDDGFWASGRGIRHALTVRREPCRVRAHCQSGGGGRRL